jgi:hypothetical protein
MSIKFQTLKKLSDLVLTIQHSADNIVPACVQCNLRKGSKTPDEYKKQVCAIS